MVGTLNLVGNLLHDRDRGLCHLFQHTRPASAFLRGNAVHFRQGLPVFFVLVDVDHKQNDAGEPRDRLVAPVASACALRANDETRQHFCIVGFIVCAQPDDGHGVVAGGLVGVADIEAVNLTEITTPAGSDCEIFSLDVGNKGTARICEEVGYNDTQPFPGAGRGVHKHMALAAGHPQPVVAVAADNEPVSPKAPSSAERTAVGPMGRTVGCGRWNNQLSRCPCAPHQLAGGEQCSCCYFSHW